MVVILDATRKQAEKVMGRKSVGSNSEFLEGSCCLQCIPGSHRLKASMTAKTKTLDEIEMGENAYRKKMFKY